MIELRPMNKYLVIQEVKQDTKMSNGLYMPGNVSSQYGTAKVLAIAECDEAKGLAVGDTVLYDTIGAVSHRVGNQSLTTIKVMNVLGVLTSSGEVSK